MAVPRHRGLGASALTARAVEAISSPGRHQETTPLTRAGAEAAEPHGRAAPVPPRPAAGSSHAGQADRQPVLRHLGVSRAGRPRRLGGRAGQTHDRTAPPVALAACVARGRDGVPRPCGRPYSRMPTHTRVVRGAARGTEPARPAHVGGAPGGGGRGPAARPGAARARHTWPPASGAPAPLARA